VSQQQLAEMRMRLGDQIIIMMIIILLLLLRFLQAVKGGE